VNPLHSEAGPDTTWTTVNTAEAMPGVQTPLSWTFWADPLELAMRGSFCDIGVLRNDEVIAPQRIDDRYAGIVNGRFIGNVNALRDIGDRMPGTSGDAVEQQMFGNVTTDLASRNSYRRYPVVGAKMPLLIAGLPKRLRRLRGEYDAWWRAGDASLPEAQQRFHDVMRPHCAATMLAQAVYEQVRALAEAAGRPGLETTLITGHGDMEETQVAADLWDVSRDRLTLAEFVARHGYHGPSEGALASHSWREDDTPLQALIATYRTMDDGADPRVVLRARTQARLQAEAEVLAALPRARRLRARAVLRMAARHIGLREVGKAAFLQAIDAGRAAARGAGAQLAADGVIDAPDDVFYLTIDEVTGTTPPGARELVAARRAIREEYLRLRLPDTWVGVARPIVIADGGAQRPDTLEGLAVSPGVIEGHARVVLDPDAGIDIEPGEILVCETTDPSWASYFLVAGALVIDIGGAMSHGAIVAREMGIPCVINTRTGTSAIASGDLVSVDGGAGTVRVVERASEETAA
jgi:pyruvate,water dikinase